MKKITKKKLLYIITEITFKQIKQIVLSPNSRKSKQKKERVTSEKNLANKYQKYYSKLKVIVFISRVFSKLLTIIYI